MELARTYDVLNTVLFATSGGSRRVRQQLLDALGVKRGQRILELGCGTGQVTELLVAAGAEVTAVDALPAMLVGARRRAPAATFIEGDVLTAEVGGGFDAMVLSFLLHNFDARGRTAVLVRSRDALRTGGRVGILDWALPVGRWRAELWRKALAHIEPSPAVGDIVEGALFDGLADAGLRLRSVRSVAGGRAQVLIAEVP